MEPICETRHVDLTVLGQNSFHVLTLFHCFFPQLKSFQYQDKPIILVDNHKNLAYVHQDNPLNMDSSFFRSRFRGLKFLKCYFNMQRRGH